MISWVLFIFVAYPGTHHTPAVVEGFRSYETCQIAGEQMTATIKASSFKCIKVEK